jgi:outer membrane lipase/esterase
MMNFPGFLSRRWRPVALAVAATLLGCGGGTSQIDTFIAERVVAFGDETSVLTADGRKYGVNLLDDQGALDCTLQPIWVQGIATLYGLVFAECNPQGVATPAATMRAAPQARVADVALQVEAQIAAGFGPQALATVLVGQNDLFDLYAEFPDRSRNELLSAARARGEDAGRLVNRIIDQDVRVIVSTVPDLGFTPFARAEKEAHTDVDRAELLSRLTEQFNAGLRTTVLNDGRFVGLVLADEMVQAMNKSPASFGLANVSAAACTVALPACTTATLVENANAQTWLWADDRQLSFGGQNRLALLAAARARDNPF